MTAMKRKRLSREDSRQLTAQRLVEAAQRLIPRRGLDALSVEDIAEAAGYSRGAFYSNFKSKNDLFFEVLRQDEERTRAQLATALDDALPPDQVQARMLQAYAALYQDADAFMTWTEGRMLSVRDAKFRAKLAALMAERRDFAVKLLQYLYKRTGAVPSVPLEHLASGFIGLIEGVRLFGASCPNEMPPEVAESILKLFADAVLQQVMQPAGASSARRR
jgi:AcrR family transcriptional regulator